MAMLDPELQDAIEESFAIAKRYHHEYVTLDHLLLSILSKECVTNIMEKAGVDAHLLKTKMKSFFMSNASQATVGQSGVLIPTVSFQDVIQRSIDKAAMQKSSYVKPYNILLEAVSEQDNFFMYFLQAQDVELSEVTKCIMHEANSMKSIGYNLGQVGELQPSSLLEKYAEDLNKSALEGKIDSVIGRDKEISRTIEILCRRLKNNPLYIGDPGIGKTSIVEGLAKKITAGEVPDLLKEARIYSLDLTSVIAGTKYRGEFEDRVKSLLKEIEDKKNAILFIDEIHVIADFGNSSGNTSIDISNILKPALARGRLKCIGATTFAEYQKYFEKDKALSRRFQRIDVQEPTIDQAIEIITGIKPYYETFHDVVYSDESIEAAVKLSVRHLVDRFLPDKAIDLIDEVGAHIKLSSGKASNDITVTSRHIVECIARLLNTSTDFISTEDSICLEALRNKLQDNLIGQEDAIEDIISTIKMRYSSFSDPKKPKGSFLFHGPSGVGKTLAALTIAEALNMKVLRVDMSEYTEKHTVSKLIGAPPGYSGHEEGGVLVNHLSRYPHSVLLFDEIEKAHHDVYKILLQMMDYGQITSNSGVTFNCRNNIIIATSNIHREKDNSIGFAFSDLNRENIEYLSQYFSQEFINRIDAIISFKRLKLDSIKQIIRNMLKDAKQVLAGGSPKVKLKYSAAVVNHIAKLINPSDGARGIQKILWDNIKSKIIDIMNNDSLDVSEITLSVTKSTIEATASGYKEKV